MNILCLFLQVILAVLVKGQSSVSSSMNEEDSIPINSNCQENRGLWFKTGKSYYIGNSTKLNWFKAFIHCKTLGLELLSIESEFEQKQIEKILNEEAKIRYGHFWISGSDLNQKGVWNWYGSGRPLVYTNWNPGKPESAEGNEQCLHLWDNWSWNDSVCNNEKYFICEN